MCILIHSSFCVPNFVCCPHWEQILLQLTAQNRRLSWPASSVCTRYGLYARLVISSLSQRRPPVTTNRDSQDAKLLVMSPHRARLQNISYYTGCPRRNVPDFGRVFLRSNYTDITQNTYIQSWTVTEIMVREVWNFDSYYSLIDYQIHIETGRNMWFV